MLNLQIVVLALVLLMLPIVLVGAQTAAVALWAVFAIVAGYGYVVGVVGAAKAWRGEAWRYPFNLRLIGR